MMLKILTTIVLLIGPSIAFAQSNPMIGKWTAEKGDCRTFVTEYTQDSFYHITPNYVFFTERKKIEGEIFYDVNLPLVEFNWVQSGGITGMRWEVKYIYRLENIDTMREVFHRFRHYSNNELFKDGWEKEDGTFQFDVKHDGKWKSLNTRLGLKTLYRCH